MQHVLQTGLSAGMSATSGFHSSKPTPVDPDFDGLKEVLPEDFVPTKEGRVVHKGAKGDVKTSHISIGAWPWGDTGTFHWDDKSERPKVHEAWKVCVQNGVNFIDTAQAYGNGESERICGELFRGMPREQYAIQTKYYPVPTLSELLSPTNAPVKKLQNSLERLGLDYVDIYLVHGPIHAQGISTIAKGMAECVEKGMTKAIGVANYPIDKMLEFADELQKYGIPCATNQVEYHPLRRYPETSGLLRTCKERGIVMQSYSSLAQGRLTGKYNRDNPPPKTYRFSSYPMEDIEPVLEVLDRIARERKLPMSAVTLNYNMCKGVLPLVGVRSPEQAAQNMKALGWRLSNDEIRQIDNVSFEGKKTMLWQQD